MADNPFLKFKEPKKVSIGSSDANMLRLFKSVQQLREVVKNNKGKVGRAGKDGLNGKNGAPGKDGLNGKNGKPGVTKTIVEHRRGVQVITGEPGADGIDGIDGANGLGIKSVEIDKGNLWVTFTDGSEKDLGKVVGSNGQNGLSGGSARAIKNSGQAADNALIKFDGDSGLASQRTGIIIDDNDNLTGLGSITLEKVYNGSITVENDYLAADKRTILVDASGGNRTITLPALEDNAGLTYNIMKIDNSSNTVTIKGAAVNDKINGEVCQVITQQYTSVSPEANDLETMWFVI